MLALGLLARGDGGSHRWPREAARGGKRTVRRGRCESLAVTGQLETIPSFLRIRLEGVASREPGRDCPRFRQDRRPARRPPVPVIDEDAQASDQVLAVQAVGGGREAFAELVARHTRGLQTVLHAALRDRHRSEDLAQEVWIKVFAALPRYRPAGSFRSWLYSIALNHLRDALRSGRARRPAPTTDVDALIDAEAGETAERRDEARRVQRVVADLEEPFRTALTLVDLAGLSYAEAADACGCSLGTVKSRVHRARLAFRDAWLAGPAHIPPARTSPDWRPSP